MNPILQGALVFFTALVADIIWARWSLSCARHNRLAAANYGALIPVVGAVSIVSYVNNLWFLVPYAIGCWAGTFLAVKPPEPVL